MDDSLDFDTRAVRAGIHRSQFNEHSEALYLTSSFVFENAAQAAARFANEEPGYVYSRFSNPTVTTFQERLAALEGAEACVATSSGMSAILSCVMGLLKSGDHLVSSSSIFGATVQLFTTVLAKFGVETTFVGCADTDGWRRAIRPSTKLLFLETPSNPLTEIADIAALADLAKRSGALLAVDNCFCTPALQLPFKLGADLVIHSATKYLDGQGRVLGGAVLGRRELILDGILGFLRTAGPSLSPFNAWVLAEGARDDEAAHGGAVGARARARPLARAASARRARLPPVARVASAARARAGPAALGRRDRLVRRARRQGRRLAGGRRDAPHLDHGEPRRHQDRRSRIRPRPRTGGSAPEAREAAGIGDGLVRVAVGLESVEDLKADLARGLDS